MNHRALIAIFALIILSAVNLSQPLGLALVNSAPTPTSEFILSSPSIVWQRTFSLGTQLTASSVLQTSDSGYVLAGTVMQISLGEIEYWVTKTDSLGKQQWSINGLQEPGFGPATSIVQTPDYGYAFVCSYGGFYGPSYLIKTDSEGKIQYNQSYSSFSLTSLKISDSGFVMAGYQNGSLALAKATLTGDVEWSQTYGDSVDKKFGFVSMVPTNDGGYALAGSARNDSIYYGVLVKIDSLGDRVWNQKLSGNSGYFQARSLTQSRQGGFVLAGMTSQSNTSSACLIGTDEQGRVIWNQTYGDLGSVARSVVSTIDGGYAFVSGRDTVDYSNLVKVDSVGNVQWSMPCGSEVYVVVQNSDGAYTLAGTRESGVWLAQTTKDTAAPLQSPTPTASTVNSPKPTLSTPSTTVTSTASPSPTIPEFSPVAVLVLVAVASLAVLALRKMSARLE